jgi:hypothetical protein
MPSGHKLCNWLSIKCWKSFLNKVEFGRCCPSVRTISPLLHAITIIRTSVRMVFPLRPNGCNSSPRLALSRMASKRMQLSSHIRVCEGNPNSPRTLTGVRTVLPRRPHKCTRTLETSQTLKSVRTCCHDVRRDATLNYLKLLDTDGRLNGIARSPDRCCWLMSVRMLYWAVRTETKDPTFLSWTLHIIFLEFLK